MTESPEPRQALIEIEVDDPNNPLHVTIHTSLVHVEAAVQNELQLILDSARLAAEAIEQATTFSGRFSDAHFHVDPANNRRLELSRLQTEARHWVLRSAFQSATELLNQPLEQARRVLELWAIARRHAAGETITLNVEEGAARFHKRRFEDKLRFLRDEYDFVIDPGAVNVVLSLHRARNCIVHRLGFVSSVDCDNTGVFRASWEEYAVFTGKPGEGGSRRVSFGETVPAGESIHMRRVTKVREFRVGETVQLTGQDVSDVCHTVHLFATQVRDDLRKKSLELGIPIDGKTPGPRLGRN
jgi:hypothetical protein